jgi:hypothetical protein
MTCAAWSRGMARPHMGGICNGWWMSKRRQSPYAAAETQAHLILILCGRF